MIHTSPESWLTYVNFLKSHSNLGPNIAYEVHVHNFGMEITTFFQLLSKDWYNFLFFKRDILWFPNVTLNDLFKV